VIVTQHNDNRRSGAISARRSSKPSNVKVANFGKLFELAVVVPFTPSRCLSPMCLSTDSVVTTVRCDDAQPSDRHSMPMPRRRPFGRYDLLCPSKLPDPPHWRWSYPRH